MKAGQRHSYLSLAQQKLNEPNVRQKIETRQGHLLNDFIDHSLYVVSIQYRKASC